MECFHIRNNKVWREKLFSLEIRCQRIGIIEVHKTELTERLGAGGGGREGGERW